MTLLERARNEANIGHGSARHIINELADELEFWMKQAINNEQLERRTNKELQTAEAELKRAQERTALGHDS